MAVSLCEFRLLGCRHPFRHAIYHASETADTVVAGRRRLLRSFRWWRFQRLPVRVFCDESPGHEAHTFFPGRHRDAKDGVPAMLLHDIAAPSPERLALLRPAARVSGLPWRPGFATSPTCSLFSAVLSVRHALELRPTVPRAPTEPHHARGNGRPYPQAMASRSSIRIVVNARGRRRE